MGKCLYDVGEQEYQNQVKRMSGKTSADFNQIFKKLKCDAIPLCSISQSDMKLSFVELPGSDWLRQQIQRSFHFSNFS